MLALIIAMAVIAAVGVGLTALIVDRHVDGGDQ